MKTGKTLEVNMSLREENDLFKKYSIIIHEGMIIELNNGNSFVIKCWDIDAVYMRLIYYGIGTERIGKHITIYTWKEFNDLFSNLLKA